MKFCVLASGSKGNCTYIEIKNHKFLIDIGTNFLYTSTKLKEINVEIKEIEAIFITHLHEDHIYGLKKIIKQCNPKIYLTKKMITNLSIELSNYELYDEDINIDDICINTIKLSHDTPECSGYIFNYEDKSLVYITDTGYINVKNHQKLLNKSVYIIESNHDVDLLMKGKYPYHIKMRILGDRGHLSNNDSAKYLEKFVGNNTKYIVLTHLSEENNDAVLALKTVKETIKKIDNGSNIYIASQHDRTELIEV